VAWHTNPAVSVTLFFRDDDGAESEHRLGLPLPALSGAVAWVMDYAQLVAAVSTCALYKIRFTSIFKDDGSQIAAPGSDAKRQTVLLFETEAAQTYVVAVPGLVASRLMQAGPYAHVQLDPADSAIAALVSLFVNGNGAARPAAPWNEIDGGQNEWEWAGVPLLRLKSAYWGYEQPGWK
jgi:hypothetical protein